MFWALQKKICQNKAQSTLEYAVIIAVVMVALLAMNIYMRRGFSGRLRDIADTVGPQYWPGSTESDLRTIQEMDILSTIERVDAEEYYGDPDYADYYVTIQQEDIREEVTQKTGYEKVKDYAPE